MKAIKIVGIVLLSLIVIVVILGLIAPKEFKVSRSITIPTQNQEVVFKNISIWSEFLKWNPWSGKDPSQKITFKGTEGTVGSNYAWAGNDDVGEGEMTITSLTPNTSVESDLHFIKPFEANNKTVMSMAPDGDGIKVTWEMSGKNTFPFSIFSLFMNMDKMVGGDFEKGLNTLKEKCLTEANTAPAAAPAPNTADSTAAKK